MTNISQKNCPSRVVGISGVCDEDYRFFIDTLPGIDIVRASDIVSDYLIRPEALVEKSTKLALDIVKRDIINLITSDFKFNKVLETLSSNNVAGTNTWLNEGSTIRLLFKRHNYDNQNVLIKLSGFTFISDSDSEDDLVFIIKIDGVVKEHTQKIVKGRNKIDINIFSKSEFEIQFTLTDFKIGIRENSLYIYEYKSCLPCNSIGSNCHYVNTLVDNQEIVTGIDFVSQCVYDDCSILTDFLDELQMPILYQTGIQYLTEAKTSSRINSYTTNSSEKIEFLLLQWRGGKDDATGLNYKSQYWLSLLAAYNGIKQALLSENSEIFQFERNRIINSLP